MSENVPPAGHLSTPQRAALDALASGATKAQAASIAKRTRRTLDRWIATEPAFSGALKNVTDAAVADAARRLAMMLDRALDVLDIVLQDPTTPHHVQLRAIDTVVGNLIKLREFDELEQRITALEERLA